MECHYSECRHVGELPIMYDDGYKIRTKCSYSQYASDMIISLQAILDQSVVFTRWMQVRQKVGHPGMLVFQ
jgi:hypothetical protein